MNLLRPVTEKDWRLAVHIFAVVYLLFSLATCSIDVFTDYKILPWLGH